MGKTGPPAYDDGVKWDLGFTDEDEIVGFLISAPASVRPHRGPRCMHSRDYRKAEPVPRLQIYLVAVVLRQNAVYPLRTRFAIRSNEV